MDEQTCIDVLEEYFEQYFEEEVKRFVDFCIKETNKTIILKYKKKDKQRSIFNVKATYRSHHDTWCEGAREIDAVSDKNHSSNFEPPIALFK